MPPAQQAYRGWALFAIALFGTVAANLGLGAALWRKGLSAWPALGAAALILATRSSRLDLAGQPGDGELDGDPGELGRAAPAMGILAGQRGADLPGAVPGGEYARPSAQMRMSAAAQPRWAPRRFGVASSIARSSSAATVRSGAQSR